MMARPHGDMDAHVHAPVSFGGTSSALTSSVCSSWRTTPDSEPGEEGEEGRGRGGGGVRGVVRSWRGGVS